MDFELAPEQRKRYAEIVDAVPALVTDYEQTDGRFSRAQWVAAAHLGLTGLCLPEKYGGGGFGALDTALCLEAFGRGCRDTGLVFAVCAHLLAGAVPIRDFGPEETRERLLPGLAAGELVAASAITEDDAGSDDLGVTASREGGDHVIDGEMSFVSNAPVADVLVTYATTGHGTSAFVVPRATPGVSIGEPMEKMGLGSCPAGPVTFRRCRVPASSRLGEEGQGSEAFARSMAWERTCLFATYLGLMDDQLERCVDRARSRRRSGGPIARFQAISHRIAEMKQRLESARLLLYRAAWLIDQRRDANAGAVALAKVAVSEAVVANSLDAIQIFGGTGYLAEAGIERHLRDSVPATLFSGTTDIQREVIAKEAGL